MYNHRNITYSFQLRDPTLWAHFVFWFIFINALNIHLHHHVPISFMTIIPSVVLHSSEENNLSKGNHLAEDKPDVNHLDVRGGGQALHLADEDGGHHQHGGQVHAQGRLKEEGLEEGGGKGDRNENE